MDDFVCLLRLIVLKYLNDILVYRIVNLYLSFANQHNISNNTDVDYSLEYNNISYLEDCEV